MDSRTPRNYSGTQNPTKKVVDLIPDLLDDLRIKIKDPKEEMFQFWMVLIGEKMAPLTEPISFVDGLLTVKVKSSTLYSLLVTVEKPRLLARLREKFSIRDIAFRVG